MVITATPQGGSNGQTTSKPNNASNCNISRIDAFLFIGCGMQLGNISGGRMSENVKNVLLALFIIVLMGLIWLSLVVLG